MVGNDHHLFLCFAVLLEMALNLTDRDMVSSCVVHGLSASGSESVSNAVPQGGLVELNRKFILETNTPLAGMNLISVQFTGRKMLYISSIPGAIKTRSIPQYEISMSLTFTNLLTHIIFTTKGRNPIISGGSICELNGCH
jgi:hypothetical protein